MDRAVYGTIVITSTLVIYDSWAHLTVSGAVAVIVGPLVAMVIGHIFAGAGRDGQLKRRSTERELVTIVGHETRFLLVCVPQDRPSPRAEAVRASLSDSVRVVIWTSAASLGFWGGIAAYRAGLRGRGIALGVMVGFAAGGVVLLVQVFLQPGTAISDVCCRDPTGIGTIAETLARNSCR